MNCGPKTSCAYCGAVLATSFRNVENTGVCVYCMNAWRDVPKDLPQLIRWSIEERMTQADDGGIICPDASDLLSG